ncbi:glucosamine-6-phosphate deaminase [Roseibacillus persicicus]|uniref:glucosamine-6-phosphate deaminase n=1 Tax=Roseibacillus persicicus TaxID=454148 RepID=UPI00398A986B
MQSSKIERSGLQIDVFPTREEASAAAADEVEALLRKKDSVNLGLATGSTPLPFYRELVRRHREEGLSFAQMEGFNLDEYEGLPPENPESYDSFMQQQLYTHIDARESHLLPGIYQNAEEACRAYEEKIVEKGGLDWQLLGIGGNGHIGFNEPGSPVDSRTRRIELDERTRRDAVKQFGILEKVPLAALTMGIGTILEAKRIVLMAWGAGKAGILQKALRGPVTAEVPASFLQTHGNVRILIDEEASQG